VLRPAGDTVVMARQSHRLHDASPVVGANRMVEITAGLEPAVRAGVLPVDLTEQLDQVESALDEVVERAGVEVAAPAPAD
jgi:HPt (histidine-containing phosphotransfer) domain-containing protein